MITPRRQSMIDAVRSRAEAIVSGLDPKDDLDWSIVTEAMTDEEIFAVIAHARTDSGAIDAVRAHLAHRASAQSDTPTLRGAREPTALDRLEQLMPSPPSAFSEPDLSDLPLSTTTADVKALKARYNAHRFIHACQPRTCEARYQLFRLWMAAAERWNAPVLAGSSR